MKSLFVSLRKELKKYLSQDQINAIYQAYLFARKAHGSQLRSSGESYIVHPMEAAKTLAELRLDKETIVAAVLHDILEDTPISKKTLEKKFGGEVMKLVDGVSKLHHIHCQSQVKTQIEAQAENFRKMIVATTRDIRIILIRLADRLHNVETLDHVSPEKRCRVAKETLKIYAPIANRLGMYRLCIELEELSFAKLYPGRYRILKNAVQKARINRMELVTLINTELQQALKKAKLSKHKFIWREKPLFSIYRKMRAKQRRFSEIKDDYGCRIIVDTEEDCYRVLGIIHKLYKPFPDRFKDYIALPKPNGYQSLHTVLFGPYKFPIEVQVRTEDMEKMAEYGVAAHWLYAESQISEQAHFYAKAWMKGLLEIQKTAGDSLEFSENVRFELFSDEIFVFTPNGEILALPSGATAVDFAYSVHSDVGNRCVAVKIDRRLALLNTPLQNGQTIEILTTKEMRLNPDWLDFVVTGKARSKIRHFLKQQKQSEAIQLGQRLLEKTLKNLGGSLETLLQKDIVRVLKASQLKTKEELFEKIGLGDQIATLVARRLMGITKPQAVGKMKKNQADPLFIRGAEGLVVGFAKCCKPIPGEAIEGVVTAETGIVIHRVECDIAKRIRKQPDKCVPVRWSENVQGEFSVDLCVDAINQRGILAKIALTASSADANVNDIKIHESDKRCSTLRLTIAVRNKAHLVNVMRQLNRVKNVLKVKRCRNE